MILLIFAVMILTGFGKAVRDKIAHHFPESVFSEVKNKKLLKWLKSDYRDFKLHFGLIRLDAWHVADFLMYCGVMGAVALSAIIRDPWFAIFYFGGSMISFQVFYQITLKKRGSR